MLHSCTILFFSWLGPELSVQTSQGLSVDFWAVAHLFNNTIWHAAYTKWACASAPTVDTRFVYGAIYA